MSETNVFFNELSLQPYCCESEMRGRILLYAGVLKRCGELGHKKVLYEHDFSNISISNEQKLSEYCYKNFRDPELNTAINLILTTQKHPYIEDDSIQEKNFVENEYKILFDKEWFWGYGLTAAYLNGSFSVGFCSCETWENSCFSVNIKENNKEKNDKVFCISRLEHFDDDGFIKWYISCHELQYTKRENVGVYNLRDDHGKDVLEIFSKKLLKEDYVLEIVNSLPFKPQATNFIEEIRENGIICIRLTKTDRGLGLAVRTVGENKLQTNYLAKLIEKKYNK